jgi:hypothetical protein
MTDAIEIPYAPHWINQYVVHKLGQYSNTGVDSSNSPVLVPTIATAPGNTTEIWEQLVNQSTTEEPLLIQYETLMRFRTSAFYPIKREQLIYYLYSDNIVHINNARNLIVHLLDRQDMSAQEINYYSANNTPFPGINFPHKVYFHNTKVYQADETRDLVDLAAVKASFTNKIIIEYDYHVSWQFDENGKWDSNNGTDLT